MQGNEGFTPSKKRDTGRKEKVVKKRGHPNKDKRKDDLS
jgi:hypothetical protein